MQCNIDQRGRRLRAIAGVVTVAGGITLLALAAWGIGLGWVMLAAGAVMLAAGAFMIYEARRGWCALRAMGIKTPL